MAERIDRIAYQVRDLLISEGAEVPEPIRAYFQSDLFDPRISEKEKEKMRAAATDVLEPQRPIPVKRAA